MRSIVSWVDIVHISSTSELIVATCMAQNRARQGQRLAESYSISSRCIIRDVLFPKKLYGTQLYEIRLRAPRA